VQQNGAKLKKNKDFTDKSLFLKDLARNPAKVLIPKDRLLEGPTKPSTSATPRTRNVQKIFLANPPPKNLFSDEQYGEQRTAAQVLLRTGNC
jgi:hypothetical protein